MHRGAWSRDYFKNDGPLVLELACGKGEYANDLARRSPENNYIGVDIKGARIWKGAKCAIDSEIKNIAFLRQYIQFLPQSFSRGEIAEIWLTFPDPFLKQSDNNKRLTSPFFLNIYQKFLRPGGIVRLKTDSDLLFTYTIESAARCGCAIRRRIDDVYAAPAEDPILMIQTYFEKKHLDAGRKIHYLEMSLPETEIKVFKFRCSLETRDAAEKTI